jgi:hypothetical protein
VDFLSAKPGCTVSDCVFDSWMGDPMAMIAPDKANAIAARPSKTGASGLTAARLWGILRSPRMLFPLTLYHFLRFTTLAVLRFFWA